jgi:phage/plasmid-associated DNA primase
LTRIFDDYVCPVNPSVFRGNLDEKPRPDLAAAMKKRIGFAVEASTNWQLHADAIKKITGGEELNFRGLYQSGVKCVPQFTPFIVSNVMPRISGADAAFRRRMVVFTLNRTMPTDMEDTSIKKRFLEDEECLSALLWRIVEGARSEMFADGVRWNLLPERTAQDTMDSFSQVNHVQEFLSWMRDEDILVYRDFEEPDYVKGKTAPLADLYAWYREWVLKTGDEKDKKDLLSMREFNKILVSDGWIKDRCHSAWRWINWTLSREVGYFGFL